MAEVAKRNPNYVFAIAGGKDLEIWNDNVEIRGIDNLLFLGYVTDEESRALSEKCLAFLHPSKYEGFGIPPLEAMMCGCPAIVSDIEVFHEVYGDSVEYCDFKDERLWTKVLKEVMGNTYYKKTNFDNFCKSVFS